MLTTPNTGGLLYQLSINEWPFLAHDLLIDLSGRIRECERGENGEVQK
jgi:hypothetical protein